MTKNGDVNILNSDELRAITERECRRRLKMNLTEFVQKMRKGQLDDSAATFDVNMMLKLAKEK